MEKSVIKGGGVGGPTHYGKSHEKLPIISYAKRSEYLVFVSIAANKDVCSAILRQSGGRPAERNFSAERLLRRRQPLFIKF